MTVTNFPNALPNFYIGFQGSRKLDPRCTNTRASNATFTADNGTVTTFDNNVPRLTNTGLLLEGNGTNLVNSSQALWIISNPGWQQGSFGTGSSVTQDTGEPDPSGGNETARAIPGTNLALHAVFHTVLSTLVVGSQVTFSLYAKAAGYNWIGLSMGSPITSGGVYFDVLNGVIGDTVDAGDGWTSGIERCGNGWFRCWVSITHAATGDASATQPQFSVHQQNGEASFSGNGTDGVLVWGAQCEIFNGVNSGMHPTSYIATTQASTATRAQDVMEIAGDDFTSWWTDPQGTMIVSSNNRFQQGAGSVYYINNTGGANDDQVRMFQYDPNDGANRIQLKWGSSFFNCPDNSTGFPPVTAAPTNCFYHDVQGTTTDFGGCYMGFPVFNDTSNTVLNFTTVRLSGFTTNQRGQEFIDHIAFYPVRLADDAQRSLTSFQT